MTLKLRLAASAAMVLLAAAPAAAQRGGAAEFVGCDGFGAPTGGGDAMTRGIGGVTTLFSNARTTAQLRRQVPTLGSLGIQNCTAALADPRLEPGHALRRASLVHGRAMHRLSINDSAAAMEDLALAEQSAAGGGPLFERSFGLSLRLARAFAMLNLDDKAGAARISSAILADRPYEPGVAFSAAQIHFAATREWDGYFARIRQLAAVDPSMIGSLFTLSMIRGQYEDAIALHPQIVFTLPRNRGEYRVQGLHERAADQVALRAFFDGAYAFALQTRGDAAGADAALAAARANLELALAPPPPREDGRGPGRQQRQRHAAVSQVSDRATEALGDWERHVRLRRLVAAGEIDQVIAELENKPVAPDAAALDLFEQMVRARPALRATVGTALGPLRERIYADVERMMAFTVADLAGRLPEPESPARVPNYEPAGASFRIRANDDYRMPSGPLAGVQTVRYASERGSISTAGELALLRAAQLARDTGRKGFIVIARRSLIRTVQTSGLGYSMERASGQEVELDVLLVDPDNLPRDYAQARWRVLDPDAIWTALSPVYRAPAAATPAS
ncbi:MAG TPA: hypothetical protein VEZ20_02560 [Allosphingosinicella sp.]|nr:hypothetical protein [Allosphingosinicella sp.]